MADNTRLAREVGAKIKYLRQKRGLSQEALALSCGYSDQSHLVHEFDELAGMAPGKLRRLLRDSRQAICIS